MLLFFPAITPWKYVYDTATLQIPSGSFYLTADNTLPRSIKPTEFWLVTDTFVPANIYINGDHVGAIIPKTKVEHVFLNLYEPPDTNIITVDNGIDAPVNLAVVVTHLAKTIEVIVRELYEFAQRNNEYYSDLISSPWSSFFASYQIPWRKELPDVRSLNMMAVKTIATVLFNSSGTATGIPNLLSGFTGTTPVTMESKNPFEYQQDLYQPLTSGFDQTGYDFHIWMSNLCVARWAAALKLVSNLDTYVLAKAGEETLTFAPAGTTDYHQHLLYNQTAGCSLYDLLIAEGCMDNISVVGTLGFTADIPICAFSHPFDHHDETVEYPGIGGGFFDSGVDFDGDYGDFDSLYDIDVLTDYWVSTPLYKTLFFDCCPDYPTPGELPQNICCHDGPEATVLSTMALTAGVTSSVTPVHPLFGGDDPGLLANPYFGLLY